MQLAHLLVIKHGNARSQRETVKRKRIDERAWAKVERNSMNHAADCAARNYTGCLPPCCVLYGGKEHHKGVAQPIRVTNDLPDQRKAWSMTHA